MTTLPLNGLCGKVKGVRRKKFHKVLDPDLERCIPSVCQDARPVCIREAGTSEAAEADGEEERGAGRSEEPERKTAGRDDSRRKDHRRAERTGQ